MSSKRENQRFVLASAARRAVERQRQVEAQIAAIGAYLARKQPGGGGGALGGGGAPARAVIPALRLDEHGRAVDERGHVIQAEARPAATIKANYDLQRAARANPYLTHKTVDAADRASVSDPRLKGKRAAGAGARPEREGFKFVNPGTFVKQAASRRGAQLQARSSATSRRGRG